METHERGLGALIGLLAVASLCIGAGEAHAQSVFFVRLAPEVGRITVEHTKEVTIQGGSSSSTSSSSGLALAGNLSVGLLLELPGSWLVGGEIESAVSSRRKLEGTISPTPNGNVHDVWPGQWDFSDLYGGGWQHPLRARARGRPLAGLRLRWNPSNVDRVRFRSDESRDRNGR